MKVLIFNAPPGAGKDYAAKVIVDNFQSRGLRAYHTKFAKFLKKATHKLYSIPYSWDYFEGELKDLPCEEFYGKTPRQAYIALSETFFKPLYGEDFFALRLCDELLSLKTRNNLIVISDGGFKPETAALFNSIGKRNICIVQVTSDGCTFDNDSRFYVDFEGVKTVKLHNNKDKQYEQDILELAESWRY